MEEENKVQCFTFCESWKNVFDGLSYWEGGILLSWIMNYAFDGEMPPDDTERRYKAIFMSFVHELDRQREKYYEYLKNKEDGRVD